MLRTRAASRSRRMATGPPASPTSGLAMPDPLQAGRRIDRALVIADGVGHAPVPLTETIPAPLLEVAGHATIDRVLDRLAAHGVGEAVVMVQRHRSVIEAHLARCTSP